MSDILRFMPLLGRILIAVLFVPAGFGKLTGFQGAVGYAESAGLPVPALGIAAAIAIELGGGLLLLVGYKARWVAAAMALFSVVAAEL
jgi:putative oxidoreductase